MPIQYAGIIEEHRAVRSAAGLFDLSHMGELVVEGADAGAALAGALVSDPPALAVGPRALLDDLRARRRDPRRPDRVPPRRGPVHGRRQRLQRARRVATRWPSGSTGSGRVLDDRSLATGLVAVQGPRSLDILGPLTDLDLAAIRYYGIAEGVGRRDPGAGRPHRLHGRGRLRAVRRRRSGRRGCGTRCSRPGGRTAWCRWASAPATRSGSRRACRSTATSSTGRRTRSRRASGGS